MSDAVRFLVLLMLGPIVTALVEAAKLLVLAGWDKELTGTVKLRVALITSFIVATTALLVTGEINLATILRQTIDLFRHLPGFWELFPALAAIFKEWATAVGLVIAVGQVVYALLKEKLKEIGWLAT